MEALQEAITIAEQERDQALAERMNADAARTAAEEVAAQAMVDLTTAQMAAATANAAVLAAAAATAGQVTFSLLPALASNTLLNYRSSEGIKIYGKATSPLDSLFDGDSGALRLFLSKVQQRAMQFGWTSILWIQQGGQALEFIEKYGQMTINSVKAAAAVHEAAND